jgi:hypothetical protein
VAGIQIGTGRGCRIRGQATLTRRQGRLHSDLRGGPALQRGRQHRRIWAPCRGRRCGPICGRALRRSAHALPGRDVKRCRCSPRHAGGESVGTLTAGDGVKAGIASAQSLRPTERCSKRRIRCRRSRRCEGRHLEGMLAALEDAHYDHLR